MNIIHWPKFYNNINFTQTLITHNADINIRNNKGLTPLHLVTPFNYHQLINLLLKNNKIINCQDTNRNTPIFSDKYLQNTNTFNFLHTISALETENNIINVTDQNINIYIRLTTL
jgi:ankyrin repeat protein